MYVVKLAFLLTLSIGCLVDIARAGAVRQVNLALMSRPENQRSVQAFVTAAEDELETQTKGVHLFNGDTISLLKKFIAAGKAIQGGDCSENSHQLINSLPTKKGSGYENWQTALDVFKRVHDTICSRKLQNSERELYSTLDRKQVDLVSQMSKIAIPIVKEDDFFNEARLDMAGSVRYMLKHSEFLDRLKNGGSRQFSDKMLSYFEKNGEQLSVIKSIEKYIIEPCQYYTSATSSIFEAQISHYSDFGSENEEFIGHFFGYQLCRYFVREKSSLLWSIGLFNLELRLEEKLR